MMLIDKNRLKRLCAAAVAVTVTACPVMTVMAEEVTEEPGVAYEAYMARLCDSRIEYDELGDLMRNFYGPIRSGYDSLDSTAGDLEAVALAMRVTADDLVNSKSDLEDVKKDNPQLSAGVNQQIAMVRANIKVLRRSARDVDKNVDTITSNKKMVDRSVNSAVHGLEALLNQYQQTLSRRELAVKAVELSQAAWNLQQTMHAQGLAVDGDILSASSNLSSSRQQLASLDAGLETMRRNIFQLTGYDVNSTSVEIGQVPHADLAAIGAIDPAVDKEAAAMNNYELISMRGSSSGGSLNMVEQQTMKSTTITRNKIRSVEYGEEQVRSNVQTLYDTIQQKKAEFDSASTAWQSAQITWNAALLQRQGGLLSDIQYMQMELAYIQAKSGYECADLALQQALRDYQWAVKGVTVTPAS